MSRSVRRGAVLLAIVLAAAGAAGAAEVIHFNNGGVLAIQSHVIEGDMVRVSLGSNASMSFPLNLVDRIEVGGRTVFSPGGTPANVVPGGDRGGAGRHMVDYPATGEGSVPARFRGGDEAVTGAAAVGWSAGAEGAAPDGSVPISAGSATRAVGRLGNRTIPSGPTLNPNPGNPAPPAVEGRPVLGRMQAVARPAPAAPEAPAPAPETPAEPEIPPEPEPLPETDGGE